MAAGAFDRPKIRDAEEHQNRPPFVFGEPVGSVVRHADSGGRELSVTVTPDDIRRYAAEVVQETKRTARSSLRLSLGVIVIAVTFVLMASGQGRFWNLAIALVAPAPLVAAIAASWLHAKRAPSAADRFARLIYPQEIAYEFGGSHLLFKSDGVSTSCPWRTVTSWSESGGVVIITYGAQRMVVPLGKLHDALSKRVRAALESRIGPMSPPSLVAVAQFESKLLERKKAAAKESNGAPNTASSLHSRQTFRSYPVDHGYAARQRRRLRKTYVTLAMATLPSFLAAAAAVVLSTLGYTSSAAMTTGAVYSLAMGTFGLVTVYTTMKGAVRQVEAVLPTVGAVEETIFDPDAIRQLADESSFEIQWTRAVGWAIGKDAILVLGSASVMIGLQPELYEPEAVIEMRELLTQMLGPPVEL